MMDKGTEFFQYGKIGKKGIGNKKTVYISEQMYTVKRLMSQWIRLNLLLHLFFTSHLECASLGCRCINGN